MISLETENSLLILRFLPPYDAGDERGYLDALVRIGAQETPFALITIFGGGGKLSPAGEREQALWFKATRQRLNAHCRAMAIVRPGATEHMAETFRKLWTMPIAMAADEAAARTFLAPFRSAP